MKVCIKLTTDDDDIPGLDVNEVHLFNTQKEAEDWVNADFEKEKAKLEQGNDSTYEYQPLDFSEEATIIDTYMQTDKVKYEIYTVEADGSAS